MFHSLDALWHPLYYTKMEGDEKWVSLRKMNRNWDIDLTDHISDALLDCLPFVPSNNKKFEFKRKERIDHSEYNNAFHIRNQNQMHIMSLSFDTSWKKCHGKVMIVWETQTQDQPEWNDERETSSLFRIIAFISSMV